MFSLLLHLIRYLYIYNDQKSIDIKLQNRYTQVSSIRYTYFYITYIRNRYIHSYSYIIMSLYYTA